MFTKFTQNQACSIQINKLQLVHFHVLKFLRTKMYSFLQNLFLTILLQFWDATTVAMKPILKLKTAHLFVTDGDGADHDDFEDEYPPFRKV